MDRLSVKVLKYITKRDSVRNAAIVDKLGSKAISTLDYLEDSGYITRCWGNIDGSQNCDHIFRATPTGRAFLEKKPGQDFDRWLTRIIAIWGAVTGTAALVLEIMQRVQ